MKNLSAIPNTVTALRIVGTAALLLVEPFTAGFFIVYSLCGLTDILDGMLARLLKCKSELGAKLDSVADMLFYGMMILRILPELITLFPVFLWIMIAASAAIRLTAYCVAAVKYRRFASLHTYLNKLSGLAVFAVPYIVKLPFALPVCIAVTAITVLASLEELIIHSVRNGYGQNIKCIFDTAKRKTV